MPFAEASLSATAAALESAKFEHSVLEEEKLSALARVEAVEADLRASVQNSANVSAQSAAVVDPSSEAHDELFVLRSRIELLDQELAVSAQRDGEGVWVSIINPRNELVQLFQGLAVRVPLKKCSDQPRPFFPNKL